MKQDSQLVEAFRETYKKAEKAKHFEALLRDVHAALADVTKHLSRQLGGAETPEPAPRRQTRRRIKRRRRARLTPDQKKDLARAGKLRGEVHKLVIRAGRLRNESPAKVYQDLRQWGASNRDATPEQLEKRKAFLQKELQRKKK